MRNYSIPLLSLIICALFPQHLAYAKTEKIRIFTWWNFITPEVTKLLKKKGFDFELVEYRSNEVALAKLLNNPEEFDLIIVSNWAQKILKKEKKIDLTSLSDIFRQRKYHKFIKENDPAGSCLPYLWASTSYAADTRFFSRQKFNLFRLNDLKKIGFKIGIIDDPIEFSAVALLSYEKNCIDLLERKNFFDGVNTCNFPSAEKILKIIHQNDFRNSIQNFMGPKTAVYGWVGEIGENIEKFDYYDFIPSDHPPVIGVDSVCVTHSSSKNLKAIDFAIELTGKEMTKLSAEEMQYFSAFTDLKVNYSPKVEKLYHQNLKLLEDRSPTMLYPPSNRIQKLINDWWQRIRYEKSKSI